jgi:hypothetical protein
MPWPESPRVEVPARRKRRAIVYRLTMEKLPVHRRLIALRSLAALLKAHTSPGLKRDRPRSDERWADLVAVADELLVLPALSRAVRDRGDAPAAQVEQLLERRLWNTLRNVRLRRQLREAVQGLNDANIVPLLFKGALHLVDGTLSDLGYRYISDLDLLVPREQFSQAGAALVKLGYRSAAASPFHQPHELGFYRADAPGPIDLHTEFGGEPLTTVLPAATAWTDSIELAIGDGHVRALSPTHQVLHSFLHAAVLDLNHAVAGLPLRQLLALRDIVEFHGTGIDWLAVATQTRQHDLAHELQDYLWLADRFAGVSLAPAQLRWHSRRHELRVWVGFALRWPPHLQRNLFYAFERAYLESLYPYGNGNLSLSRARARHAAKLLRRDRSRLIEQGVRQRV